MIRNAGGVVTADEIRSLAISQRLLGTREIVLIHHTDCGMLTFTDDERKKYSYVPDYGFIVIKIGEWVKRFETDIVPNL